MSCDTNGCIHPTTSRVSLQDADIILITYTIHQILRVDMVFVSCAPASSFDISVLHGQTFVLSNDSSASSCPISGRTFFIRDLSNTTFTNANTKLLDKTLLFYDNVLIVLDNGYYRFFCIKEELIVYGTNKIMCTARASNRFT